MRGAVWLVVYVFEMSGSEACVASAVAEGLRNGLVFVETYSKEV
jgi:hypothetical protein